MNDLAYRSFDEFYQSYLREHSHPWTRRLHFLGTTLVPVILVAAVATNAWWLIVVAVVQVYALSWFSHYVIEKNKPVAFDHPWLCLLSDWRMWWEMASGKRPF